MARIGAAFASLAFLLAACADPAVDSVPDDAPPVPDFVEKVRNGTLSQERPEVGGLSFGCTGTLVAPDVVITAAHCVGYGSATRQGNYGTFTVTTEAGRQHQFRVQRYRAFSRNLGSGDLAILQLAERVDPSVAPARPLARTTPADGSRLSVWGYGCTERGYRTDWKKRYAEFDQGDPTNHLCPGDSGGPVFDEATGAVLRINSGYYQDRFGTDIFGHVPTHYDAVRAQVEEWSAGDIPEIGDEQREEEPDDGDQPEDEGGGGEQQSPGDSIVLDDEVCGQDRQVFSHWACTPDAVWKYQCVQGGNPTWKKCAAGCRQAAAGQDAKCGEEAVPQYREGCGVWQPYPQWTCARDARTLVRCQDDRVQAYRCRSGCTWVDGPDHCRVQ